MRLDISTFIHLIYLLNSLLVVLCYSANKSIAECSMDDECQMHWPNTACKRGKCACAPNSIRRASESNSWVCLSLFDAVTGMLGPPLSCPLPEGAGFRVILKKENNEIVFCKTPSFGHNSTNPECPADYECIRSIGTFSDQWNGVCCPTREISCSALPDLDQNSGWLERWYFNGSTCEKFMWNPESTSTSNTFLTQQHCISYCG